MSRGGLSPTWSKSKRPRHLMRRVNFVKRKGIVIIGKNGKLELDFKSGGKGK
jgi:hypothetical protein